MSSWNEERALNHLLDLALEHDIAVTWISAVDWQESQSFPSARWVCIPVPISFGEFLVGLHEFGHILGQATRDEVTEGRAWLWAAREAALVTMGS
jgi:hypothetical protein